MISKLSYLIADFLYNRGNIQKSEKEIYQYGYTLLFDGLLGTILLLTFGIILQKFIPTVIFIIVFTTTRMFAGGYHAYRRWKCILILLLLWYICVRTGQELINIIDKNLIMVLGIVICFTIFIIIAPVETHNKYLKEGKVQQNKTRSLGILSLYVIIMMVTFNYNIEFAGIILVTLFEVTMLMVVGRILQILLKTTI